MPKRLTLIPGLMALMLAAGSVALYRAATGSLPMLNGKMRSAIASSASSGAGVASE